MIGNFDFRLAVFIGLLFFFSTSVAIKTNHQEFLRQSYDDGSEMVQHIIKDYLVSDQCTERCADYSYELLSKSFNIFQVIWVQRMINYVIEELNLDADSARSIKKSPSNYMVNYQTFKLLAFR